MIIDPNFSYLLLTWFLGWGIYFYAGRIKARLSTDTDLATAYFFFLAALSFFIGKRNFPDHVEDNMFFYFGVIVAIFLIINHIYFVIRQKFNEPLTMIIDHPTDHWLDANRRSIFVTLSHILFQQIIITSLIIIFWQKYGDLQSVTWHFAAFFALIHIPLFVIKGYKFMFLYTLPATVAGLIFPILLIKYGFAGLVLNYVIHSAFYVFLTYIFWYKEGEISNGIRN